ncbi:serine protein kinase RIO [Halococcoides cellulosivorans]|uniref:non-specific serine/threonine protein kinase n=1 Tax=Halococcoides cellulosivorans TaxID=1679096 RepID=A0A2R4X1M3_9EURY|nr:serine protein kinase RIO [Halococcoides cellulosivorans]AWB27690.1 serine protein kinase RIO [Halococcoides cellulosivorans]
MSDFGLLDLDEAETPGDEFESIDVADTEADRIARRRDREFSEFRKRIKDTEQFKVEASVFDDATFAALYKLVQDGYIDAFGAPISTGKEANVYTALAGSESPDAGGADLTVDTDGDEGSDDTGSDDTGGDERDRSTSDDQPPTPDAEREVAVKVYRINASDFKDMRGYLDGDPRFEGIGSDKKKVVTAWVRKEFANLRRAREAGVRVPEPIAVERNVLVMEYIATEAGRAKRLNEVHIENPETAFEVLREYMRRLHRAGLVHGDLSEYNVVFHEGQLVVIDLGQAVTTHSPNAEDFLRRDCTNVANFFASQGVEVTSDGLYEFVTAED